MGFRFEVDSSALCITSATLSNFVNGQLFWFAENNCGRCFGSCSRFFYCLAMYHATVHGAGLVPFLLVGIFKAT